MNYVWITFSFEGFHCYPYAPEEVSFLRYTHRHIFHAKVYLEVFHEDRDIEFIEFKHFCEGVIKTTNFNNMSCEMISDNLHLKIHTQYPNRKIIIEVSEDNENGSRKEYE